MRIVQLIDSLDAGGAERMAVNYANTLVDRIEFSGLVATRKEGVLKATIRGKVVYEYLNKKDNWDFASFYRLRVYCIKNEITHLHAHGSSFFWAILIKMTAPKIKLIWHDHLGSRTTEAPKRNKNLIYLSRFFDVVITVNAELKNWAIQNLKTKTIIFLPNFTFYQNYDEETFLNGIDDRRIIILANLKNPKNHLFFVKIFHHLKLERNGWTLHLVGQEYQDEYVYEIKRYIKTNLISNIYFYGQVLDIEFVLKQAKIGVLTSSSEGFPVTLLEYAKANLILFSTNVGECSKIILNESTLFDPTNDKECATKLQFLINGVENNSADILQQSKNVNDRILMKYSEVNTIKLYLKLIQ